MSPLRTGIAAQLGIADESTHGTYVAPTRFLEFVSESLSLEIERLESAGLRAGQRVLRSDRWAAGRKTVGGDIQVETVDTALGLLLKHMFGSVATADVGGASGAFEHTFTPGDLPAGMTAQVGRPDLSGTVRPFSYLGCKVASWTVAGQVGQIGLITATLDAQDETTAQALASASYAANNLLTFVEASLTIAAAAVDVRQVELSGDNALATDRHKLSTQLRDEPLEGGMRQYTGTIDADFEDLTAYNRFINGTEAALVFTFQGPTDIEAGFPPRLRFTCNVRFDGETPQVGGPDEVRQSLPYKCVDSGAGPDTAITCTYQTSDATP